MSSIAITLASKVECTGCAACHDVCAQKAITMTSKGELHAYPMIDTERCVQCGRCMAVCPSLQCKGEQISAGSMQCYYYSWSKSMDERMASTSGGVGSALMRYAMNEGYYVCAPAFDDKWMLAHHITNDIKDIDSLRGSKYLQSNTTGVYKKLFEVIKEGGKVFFVGTPCQIEAMKTFIPTEMHDQIVSCGIICHGVNSSVVWNDYIDYLQKKEGEVIVSYNFRSKSRGWGKLRVSYTFNSGKITDVPAWNNLFHYWFGKHYILRPSCMKCIYRKEQRNSDITIGDFWGIERIVPNLNVENGVTALITSTNKGEIFINACKDIYKSEVAAEKAISVLLGFIDRTDESVHQLEIQRCFDFKTEYLHTSFEKMAQRYPKQSMISYYWSALKRRLK